MNESVMDPQGPSHEKSWMICNLQIQHAFVEKWGILLERSPVNRKGQHIQTDRHIHSHILTHRQFGVFFFHLTCMSLDYGKKSEQLQKTHSDMLRN